MRRIVRPTLALVAMLITAVTFNNCTEEDLSIKEHLDKLVESTINSVEGQKASINKTINYLKSLEPSLDAYSKQTVVALEDSLQSFVDNELANTTDWYSATVATLAQYENAVSKLALLGEYMSGLCAEYGDSVKALSIKIDNAIISMQEWVNTTLTNYYDIAQVDAKLALLYSQMLASDSTHLADVVRLDLSIALLNTKFNNIDSTLTAEIRKIYSIYDSEIARIDSTYSSGIADVDSKVSDAQKRIAKLDSTTTTKISQLHDQLDSAKVNLTKAYTEAISSAIETNNGVIDTKIATEIATVNTRIDNEINAINLKIASLEGRISALEERVNELSKQLGIRFSDNDISCSPGDVVTIDYTIINGTDSTTVYALPSNGYKVKIIPATKSTGSIKVTVPNPIEDCSILIFVNNADRTVLKSLNFISGTMSISTAVVMADADGGDISVDLSTDLQYSVKIPEEITWVHYTDITTKSVMRNETINLSVDENMTPNPRSTIIELVNGSGLTIGGVTIRQGANVMQANEIWYTSVDASTVEPSNPSAFGVEIIGNQYGKNKGVLLFSDSIRRIGSKAFQSNTNIKTITLPEFVEVIGSQAFAGCESLSDIHLSDSLKEIGYCAFNGTSITNLVLPNTIERLGEYAFMGSKLKHIIIPESIKSIYESFYYCQDLIDVALPDKDINWGGYCFMGCRSLTHIQLPSCIKTIIGRMFAGCTSLTEIIIPESVSRIEWEAFSECSSLQSIYIKATNVPTLGEDAFADNKPGRKIYVPIAVVDQYKSQWPEYASSIEGVDTWPDENND